MPRRITRRSHTRHMVTGWPFRYSVVRLVKHGRYLVDERRGCRDTVTRRLVARAPYLDGRITSLEAEGCASRLRLMAPPHLVATLVSHYLGRGCLPYTAALSLALRCGPGCW